MTALTSITFVVAGLVAGIPVGMWLGPVLQRRRLQREYPNTVVRVRQEP